MRDGNNLLAESRPYLSWAWKELTSMESSAISVLSDTSSFIMVGRFLGKKGFSRS